ncbi:hypothetical protein [Zwartia sp.]|uniref:hypothetical protein n=1 Tax=Zwartia sp. TaxID=2978004 RepID=UPI003C75B3BD
MSSPRRPHLLVTLSSHGFGHLSQAAPVINQLRELIPNLRLTIRATFPADQIQKRILNPNVLQPVADDFGMVMRDALTVDLSASLLAYQKFHASMPERIEHLSEELLEQKIDLVLADVPYLTLAAAKKVGIPSVALCSLNWADVLEHALLLATSNALENTASSRAISPELARVGAEIVREIRGIYQQADCFLLPTPSMPILTLTNTRAIGPVCTPGIMRREALAFNTQVTGDVWFVLVGMGGMPFDLELDEWSTHMLGKPIHYIVAGKIAQISKHPHVISETQTGLSYSDLVSSVDLILTKPGYGMFVEAAAAGVPVLYVERRDWPEAKALTDWLEVVAHCTEISTEVLHRGDFVDEMRKLLELGRYDPVAATGNMQGATFLAQYICSTGEACRG